MAQSASTPPAATRQARRTGREAYTTRLTTAQAEAALADHGTPADTAAQLVRGLIEAPFPDPYATYGGVTVVLADDGEHFEARPALAGPACQDFEWQGGCRHDSCMAVEAAAAEMCEKHGWQQVTDMGSGAGFAGGRIYWTTLACGCTDMDETGDVAGAR